MVFKYPQFGMQPIFGVAQQSQLSILSRDHRAYHVCQVIWHYLQTDWGSTSQLPFSKGNSMKERFKIYKSLIKALNSTWSVDIIKVFSSNIL